MEYLSTQQAAEALGVNDSRIRQLVRAGLLKAEKVGRDWLIPPAEVQRLKANPLPKGRPPKAKGEKPRGKRKPKK
ncbi:hypothetical protein AYO44_03865 [Planctomycetaceae bacterium SCGC AG-212-F19]|nr:hypothetical protein AYO44_03865 [Planctomycetaceae bacterium SCGC AG-212-F19]